MTASTHEEALALLDSYALGALAPDEAEVVDRHLLDCVHCGEELRDIEDVVSLLPLGVPLRRHGAALKVRLMGDIARDAGAKPARRGGSLLAALGIRSWQLKVAAASFVALLLGWAVALQLQVRELRQENESLDSRIEATQARLPDLSSLQSRTEETMSVSRDAYDRLDEYQLVIQVVSAPNVAWAKMEAVQGGEVAGEVYWDPDRRLFAFLFQNLPEIPDDAAYEVWLWREGKPWSGGTFTPSERGYAQHLLPSSAGGMKAFDLIAVTVEPRPGSSFPTGSMLLKLQPQR